MASIQWIIRWSWLICFSVIHAYVMYTAGGISATIIVAVLIIAALSVTLAIIILANSKLKNDRHQNVIQRLKSELRSGIVMIAHPCDWSCSQLWIHMWHQFIISGDKSDPNDTPVTPPDEKENNIETDHSNSGNEDEGHASTQRVYMCYVSHSVSLIELIYHVIMTINNSYTLFRRFLCDLEDWRALCRIPSEARVLLSPEVF